MNPLEARRRLLGRNVYKRTTEGNPAIAQGSLARMYPGITMQGWTEQDSTTGAQLWDEANEAEYVNGRRYVFHCEPNTDYTFSTDVTVSSLGVLYGEFNNENVLAVKYNATELTFNSGEYDTLYMQVYDPENFGDIKVMLNAGSTVLPHELYTGGKPSPSPDYPQEIVSAGNYDEATGKYKYEVKLTGVNLFDASEIVEGIISNGELVPNINFVTSGFIPVVSGRIYSRSVSGAVGNFLYNEDKSFLGSVSGTTIEIPNNAIYVRFCIQKNGYDVNKIMFNEGSSVFPYEPYRPPQNVPLTADRPLTKWDRLEKRNGQWGWVYKSAEIKSYTDESVPGEYYSTTGQLSVGAQVWYETATETFVPLSPEEQEQMNALHTFCPTTVLSNDEGCEMSLTYKTKKSLEVTT